MSELTPDAAPELPPIVAPDCGPSAPQASAPDAGEAPDTGDTAHAVDRDGTPTENFGPMPASRVSRSARPGAAGRWVYQTGPSGHGSSSAGSPAMPGRVAAAPPWVTGRRGSSLQTGLPRPAQLTPSTAVSSPDELDPDHDNAPPPHDSRSAARRRPAPLGHGLRRSEQQLLIRRLAADSHLLSQTLDSLATTQASLADVLTGRAGQLRRELREARRRADDLTNRARGFQIALETQQRDNADLRARLQDTQDQIHDLQHEYQRLRQSQSDTSARGIDDERRALFAALGNMLVQLPTARRRIEGGHPVTGRDLLGLLKPLDAVVAQLGFVAIGSVGETVAFDPARHQPTASFAQAPQPGHSVVIQFIGFSYRDEILRKAQVAPPAPELPTATAS